jgi:hypothetical protein
MLWAASVQSNSSVTIVVSPSVWSWKPQLYPCDVPTGSLAFREATASPGVGSQAIRRSCSKAMIRLSIR